MSFLDIMEAAIESPQTALHTLLSKMSNSINTLHVYYEGKCDNKLYYGMIRRLVGDTVNIRTIVCGNKKKVFAFKNELAGKSNKKNKIIFFVDKDIDNFFNDNDFLITNDMHQSFYYSIENYVVCEQILISICRECFDMSNLEDQNNDLYIRLVQTFKSAQGFFFEKIKEIMIFAFIARESFPRPVLSSMKFSDLFYFDERCNINFHIKGDYESLLDYFIAKTGCDISGCLNRYDYFEEMLNNIDERCYVRGKYQLEMFCSFLLSVQKAVGVILPYKQKFQINDESIFLFSGPRIIIPSTIKDFIKERTESFVF